MSENSRTPGKYDRMDFLVLLTDKLQGEEVKAVAITRDGYYRLEFKTGDVYIPVETIKWVEPKPL